MDPTALPIHEGMQAPEIDRRQRAGTLRLALFGNAVPIVIALAAAGTGEVPAFYVGAALGIVAPAVVVLTSRRTPVPFYLAAYGGLPALTAMQAGTGGAASGYAVLLMMAMVWFGAQAGDREIAGALVVLTLCAFGPMLVFGAPDYPVSWGHAAILVFVGATVTGSLRMLVRETQMLTARLRRQATIDSLTDVLNRRGWMEAAARDMARARREGSALSLALVDLDAFKTVNDTLGHEEGDRVLADTASRLRSSLRAGDLVARLGGDEFVALVVGSDPDDALGAVTRLAHATPEAEAFSAGFAIWDGREGLDELMRRADLALYAAKTSGGGRVEVAAQGFGPTVPAA
jgi:diguanylate cyclase (GGDEF)-like protein